MTVASLDTSAVEARQRRTYFWVMAAIGLAVALVAPKLLYSVFLMMALCFALFASAFNLLFGYLGLLSFGHAAFFGGAAYATGWSIREWGFTPELGILFGGIVAAAMGIVVGVLAVRRSGIYFAMITFAMAELVYFLANQLPFTGGENGLTDVPRSPALGFIDISSSGRLYYFILVVTGLSIWALWRIVHSPFGNVLKAIHQNEARAISLGYDVQRYKIIAFVLSAFFSGIAGGAKVLVFQFAALADVHWSNSGEPVMMTLMGGMGTTLGPAIGAFFVTGLQFYLAEFGEWVTIIYGGIFMIFVLALRRGVMGEAPDLIRNVRGWLARRKSRREAR